MKNKLFITILRFLRKIAALLQVGNPAGKAPLPEGTLNNNEKLFTTNYGTNDVSIWRLKNVICSGLYGGAVISEQNSLYAHFTSFPWGNMLHPVLSSPFLGKKKGAIDKAIFLITPEAKGNYYHWIADLLPRLALIKQCKPDDFEERVIILHCPSRVYETECLSVFHVKEDKIIRLNAFEFVSVSDLLITDITGTETVFPLWKKTVLTNYKNEILRSVSIKEFKKIYLLRGKQRKRLLIGEERLVRMLQEVGFSIIDPEKISFEEQVSTLAGAQVVVALHGASLTNILFCSEGTQIIELRSSHKPPEFFSQIATTYNLTFDSIILPPQQTSGKGHVANKQNLLMTETALNILMSMLSANPES